MKFLQYEKLKKIKKMLVEILKDIFDNVENNLLLNEIYFQFGEKHKLLIRDDEDIDALMNSSWYNNLSDFYQETIRKSIIWSMNNSTKEPKCIISSQNSSCFGLKEALKYLEQPFIIVIENRKNDAFFIDCLLKNFPKEGRNIIHFKNERWLKYGMGGGSTISQDIDAELESFSNPIFVKERYIYLRYFVIIDSDRRYPNFQLTKDKNDIIEKLNQNNIPYHILEKREIENYLPDEAFEEIKDNQEFISEYLKLKPIQKDYFNLELGFGSRSNQYIAFNKLPIEEQEFYFDLSDSQKEIFRSKSLQKINNTERVNFKEDFPKLFLSEKVNKSNLLERCNHHFDHDESHPFDKNELPNLLKKINELL